MEELLASLGGGSPKQTNPTIIHPSQLGKRNHKVFFRSTAFVFGILSFTAFGSIFESIRVLRFVLYFALIAFTLLYKNPRLMHPQQRLFMGSIVCFVVELTTLILNGGL
jgi:hypothetical protein